MRPDDQRVANLQVAHLKKRRRHRRRRLPRGDHVQRARGQIVVNGQPQRAFNHTAGADGIDPGAYDGCEIGLELCERVN